MEKKHHFKTDLCMCFHYRSWTAQVKMSRTSSRRLTHVFVRPLRPTCLHIQPSSHECLKTRHFMCTNSRNSRRKTKLRMVHNAHSSTAVTQLHWMDESLIWNVQWVCDSSRCVCGCVHERDWRDAWSSQHALDDLVHVCVCKSALSRSAATGAQV